MKLRDFVIDLCLVGLFLFVMNSFLNNYNIKKTMFEKDMIQFEENIKKESTITKTHGTTSDMRDNTMSLVVKSVSDFCIKIIETMVLIISNLISMLL